MAASIASAVLEVADLVGDARRSWCARPTSCRAATAVSYIGWNAYGATWHSVASGSYRICPKPLAMLAVIEPCPPVLRSLMSIRYPAGVSCMCTRMRVAGVHQQVPVQVGVQSLRTWGRPRAQAGWPAPATCRPW